MNQQASAEGEAVAKPSGSTAGIRRAFVVVLIGVAVVPASIGALLGLFAGGAVWFLDLFNHFWAHYAALFLVTSVMLAVLRSRRLLVVSLVMLGLSAWQAWPVVRADGRDRSAVMVRDSDLRLLHFNVNTSAGDPDAVAAYLAEQDADVVFLQEVSRGWLDALGGRIGPYELVIAEPRSDNFGIACYLRTGQDRVAVRLAEIVDQTDGLAAVPAIELELEVESFWGPDSSPVVVPVLSLHTLPPVGMGYAEARDAQLKAAGAWAKRAGENAVVIGDLNATPWSKPFAALLEESGLRDSGDGFGRGTTWPAGLPAVLGIPIDHCLHGRGFHAIQRRVGKHCGSDHRALHVTLRQSGG